MLWNEMVFWLSSVNAPFRVLQPFDAYIMEVDGSKIMYGISSSRSMVVLPTCIMVHFPPRRCSSSEMLEIADGVFSTVEDVAGGMDVTGLGCVGIGVSVFVACAPLIVLAFFLVIEQDAAIAATRHTALIFISLFISSFLLSEL